MDLKDSRVVGYLTPLVGVLMVAVSDVALRKVRHELHSVVGIHLVVGKKQSAEMKNFRLLDDYQRHRMASSVISFGNICNC